MIHVLLQFLASAGFVMLCLARHRHQRDLLGRHLSTVNATRLRAGGFLCLVTAFLVAGLALGWGYGAIEWLGQLSVGALAAVFLLTVLSARSQSPP